MSTVSPELIASLTLFNGISPSTVEALTRIGRIHTYNNGEYLFLEKEFINTFYIILEGTVSLYKTNANGQSKTIFIFGRDHLVNENLFDNTPTSINCKVHHHCTVLAFYDQDLLPLLEQDFTLTKNLVNHLSKRIRRLYRQAKNATSVIKMEKKLAAKIWKLAQDYGIPDEKGIKINFPITITALSDLMGSYRETISRSLKILASQNLIIYENKYIYVPDSNRLSIFFKTS